MRSSRSSIACCLLSFRGDGAERVMIDLAQGIAEAGLPVELISAEGAFPDPLPPSVGIRSSARPCNEIEVVYIPVSAGAPPPFTRDAAVDHYLRMIETYQ